MKLQRAVAPLRLIFWGGLLCVFDLSITWTVNRQGFKFDILNDALGAVLIAIGVCKLAGFSGQPRYVWAMFFVVVVALLSILDTIRAHFILPLPDPVHFALSLFSLVRLVAVVVFCVAMRWLCQEKCLPMSAASWLTTTWLFGIIYLLVLGLFYIAAAGAIVAGTSFNINLGPAGLLLLPVFALPIIHLFVSTSRMKREAESARPVLSFDESADDDEFEPGPPLDDWRFQERK